MGASFGCSSNGRKALVVGRSAAGNSSSRAQNSPAPPAKADGAQTQIAVGLAGCGDFGLRCLAWQRIVGAIIERADAVAVETLLLNLEVRAEQQLRRQLL